MKFNDQGEDLAALMEDPPGGLNHGRKAPVAVDLDEHPAPSKIDLDGTRRDFLSGGGWSAETGTAHRGVLHTDEYVDTDRLQALVEKAFGFTYAQISAAYKTGRPTAEQRQQRDKIDARLLALSRSGGNMLALAKALGWPIEEADDGGQNCRKMERALARARQAS